MRCRKRKATTGGVEAERIGRVGLGFGDCLTAWPDLSGIIGGCCESADFTVPVDYRRPHPGAVEESANGASDGSAHARRILQVGLELARRRKPLTVVICRLRE